MGIGGEGSEEAWAEEDEWRRREGGDGEEVEGVEEEGVEEDEEEGGVGLEGVREEEEEAVAVEKEAR